MKKRLLSALLALALVFVLLPTTALAEVTTGDDYDISINGRGWKFEKDTTSGACIPVYYYGYSPSNYFFSTKANDNWATNSNLKLTKEGNTVTITIRPRKAYPYESPNFTLKKESTEKNDVPCIEMGNDNNLVITGKGTLNITRNENKSYGAALYSNVGDITINGGITVNVSFLNGKDYYNKNVSSNAIYVGDNHNLTVSGSGTNVTATNQGFDSSPATVCVEGGTITVSGGASLSATNTYDDNRSGSDDVKIQHFNSYAISGTKSNPCTLIVADEKSSVTATTNDFTNIAESWAFKYTTIQAAGATIKAGSSASNSTVTTIDNISGQRYAKISVPALETTADVLIAKENAVVGVETSIPSANGSGTYFYDQASKTLTLNNVNIASSSIINGIQFTKDGTYTIKLVGTNTMSGFSTGISANSADQYVNNINITITGAGSLEVSTTSYAIAMNKGNLKFENTGEIKLTTSNPSKNRNVLSVSGIITITDMDKYSVTGITQTGNPNVTGDTVTLSEESHLKGYQNPDDTWTYLKTITIASKPSETYYNGTAMKYGETRNAGSGTISCDENGAITLNGATEGTLEFRSSADSTLVLKGANTLSSIVTTQKGLTISGSGSLTVGSIRVTNNDNISADLIITGGAHVTVNRPSSEDKPAVEVSGNLTVTGEGTQLSAECTAATNPAIEVGGNVTISGNPGTNAYTVKAYNKYDTPRDRVEGLSPSQMPSAIEISGDSLSISNSARVMAKTKSDGAAVWMPALKVISVADASLIAQNSSHNFSTISFGDESNMGNIYAKGQVNIVAENMLGSNSRLAHKAIKAYIYNHYSTGDSNPYYIKVVSEGVQSGGNVNVIPGHHTSTGDYKVTITRGDAYTTPQVAANYTIAGQTMHVGKYYKTDAYGNITDGTAQDYNIYCDSENDFTLNNATISSTGTGGSTGVIMTNLNYSSAQFHIKLIGTNRINNAGHHAILGEGAYSTIIIENAENASNASLTISGNFLPVYSFGNVTINAEVVIINTNGNLISTIKDGNANGAFDLGSGYKCYASASTTGNPLEEFNSANYSTYKYLRVTTQTLETGGGSTHEHVFSTSWESNADYHWHKCTVQGCTEVSDKEAHVYTNTWWKNSNGNHGRTCDKCRHEGEIHEFIKYYDFADETYHVERCGYLNCTYVGRQETHSYDSFGVCKCGYSPNGLPAPPSLQGVAPTSENGTDGKILNSNIGMEYAQNLNGPWTKWNEHSNITGLSAGTYYVRYTKTDERFPDNQVATVEVPAYTPGGDPTPDIPAAPTGLAGVAPTSANSKDGKITGTTAAMEYATEPNGSNWIECGGDEVTGLSAGTYYVRYKRTTDKPASAVATVVVPAYSGGGEIVPPTPDNPGTIVIIRPAEEEKPAQQPNPSTGANDLVGLAVAAAVAAALGSAALLRKHD